LYSFDVSRENMGPSRVPAGKGGTTALHEAARAVRTDLVKYLLDHGADPNLLDVDGKKPIEVINVQRPAGHDPVPSAVAADQAKGAAPVAAPGAAAPPAGAGRGAGRGAPGRGGANPAAVGEIRAMLEAA